MKKVLKVIGIIVAVSAVLVTVLLVSLGKMAKEKNEKYYEYTNPVGAIEKKYSLMGSSEVSTIEFKSDNAQICIFVIFYPAPCFLGLCRCL